MDRVLPHEIEEHAKYVASITDATEKEAEAYFHNYFSKDETSQDELARRMNIRQSTFSEHLSKGFEKIQSPEIVYECFKKLIMCTNIGGIGRTKKVISVDQYQNGYLIVCKDNFEKNSRISCRYEAHLIYREDLDESILEDCPENCYAYEKWSEFAIKSDTKQQLVDSVSYYMDCIDDLDYNDKIVVMKNLMNNGFPADDQREKAVDKAIEELTN